MNIAVTALSAIVPSRLDMLSDAARLEIWLHIWRENYARTIVSFVNNVPIRGAVQPKPDPIVEIAEHVQETPSSNPSSGSLFSVNDNRCTLL